MYDEMNVPYFLYSIKFNDSDMVTSVLTWLDQYR